MTTAYQDKMATRKANLDKINLQRINAKKIADLEAQKTKAIKDKAEADKKTAKVKADQLKKIPAPFASANDPQKAIKPEAFTTQPQTLKTNDQGFFIKSEIESDVYDENDYFSDDQVDSSNNSPWEAKKQMNGMGTLGFDLFGVNIDTSALADKATALAQAQVTKYLAPAAPVAAQTPAQVAAAVAANTTTNYVTQPLDPQLKKILTYAGIGFGGLIGTLLIFKIIKAAI